MDDRQSQREKPRLSTNHPVTLTVFTGKESNSFPGRLVDASHSGLGIIVDSAIPLGAVVEVRSEGGVVYGEVQDCRKALLGYWIGVVVEEGLSGEWLRDC